MGKQNVRNDKGALATRQNQNGNRYGTECAEERDYYPYWHPSQWRDLAVLTSEPQRRCAYYQQESENVKGRHWCMPVEGQSNKAVYKYNNQAECEANQGQWKQEPAHGIPPPECLGSPVQRDNHLGNVDSTVASQAKQPVHFVWRIPENITGTAVLRIRYNVTSGDFKRLEKAAGAAGRRASTDNTSDSEEFLQKHGRKLQEAASGATKE